VEITETQLATLGNIQVVERN